MMDTGAAFHVLVIGAGTTGLLVGQGLRKAGISCSIFERDSAESYKTRTREWGMTLHWGTNHFDECLPQPLIDRLQSIHADQYFVPSPGQPVVLPIYNGKTGDLLTQVEGDNPVRVSRRKMRALFAEGLDIQYDKKLVDVTCDSGQVTATFEDGSKASGNMLVGCDGAKSHVRGLLLGEKAKLTDAPVMMFNFTQSYTAEQALHVRSLDPISKFSVYEGTGEFFWISIQDVPDPDKPETWLFQIVLFWSDERIPEEENTNERRVRFFKERAAKWIEPFRSAGLWVKDDTIIPKDTLRYWANPVKWDNYGGRITLCGDSAHPMTPHRGQGLNHAIQDASNLVAAIKCTVQEGDDLGEKITAYDAEMLERGSTEIKISLAQTLAMQDWDKFINSVLVKGIGLRRAPPTS